MHRLILPFIILYIHLLELYYKLDRSLWHCVCVFSLYFNQFKSMNQTAFSVIRFLSITGINIWNYLAIWSICRLLKQNLQQPTNHSSCTRSGIKNRCDHMHQLNAKIWLLASLVCHFGHCRCMFIPGNWNYCDVGWQKISLDRWPSSTVCCCWRAPLPSCCSLRSLDRHREAGSASRAVTAVHGAFKTCCDAVVLRCRYVDSTATTFRTRTVAVSSLILAPV